MRVAPMSVGLPYFKLRIANRLAVQIEHASHHSEDLALRAPWPTGYPRQIGILIKGFQWIEGTKYLLRRTRHDGSRIANLVETTLATPVSADIFKISRRLRSPIVHVAIAALHKIRSAELVIVAVNRDSSSAGSVAASREYHQGCPS